MKRKLNLKLLPFFCFATMMVTSCGGGGTKHNYEEHAAVAATCETKGNKKYYTCSETACKGKYYNEEKKEVQWSEIEIAPLGHDYDLKYTWTGDSCKGEGTCKRSGCGKHIEETKKGTYVVDVNPTCIAKEEGHYHVEFDNKDLKTADSDKIEGELGDHELEKVEGKQETCMEDGYKDAYKCKHCNTYYSINDPKEENKIGDETAYSNWKKNGGKIDKHAHTTQKVTGSPETCTEDGWKDAYKCTECNNYFEESTATTLIGDETAYTAWKTAGGKIAKHAHSYGNLVAQVDPTRDADGKAAYYECSECHGLFDKDKNPTTEEKLVIKHELAKYEFDETYTGENGVKLPDISKDGVLIVDVKLATPTTKPARIDFAVAEGWDNYAGRFEITKSTNGIYSTKDQYSGVSIGTTEDGYCRVYINLAKVTNGQNIDKITKYDLMMVKAADGKDFEQVKGDIRVSPSTEISNTDVKRGYTLDASSWIYLIDGKWSHKLTEKICIDFKFEDGNTKNLAITLYDDWNNYSNQFVILNDSGTFEYEKEGAQVIKVADEKGFIGGYYRLIIDLSYHASWTKTGTLTQVNRIALKDTGCKVTIDVDPINCLTNDSWYTIKGSTTADVKIDLYTYNTVTIRDNKGNLFDKNLYFEVKGEGGDPTNGSAVKFALMDGNSKNCSSVVLTFKEGVLDSAKFWGSAGDNTWGKINSLGDDKYSVTISLDKLRGGDISTSNKINYYNGTGIIQNGVTSFSFNFDSFKLVDKTGD